MREPTKEVTAEQLVPEVHNLKDHGWRLVTATCVELDDVNVDLIYTFDKNNELQHLRMVHPKDKPVPSISPVLFAALLIENEIRDHFGLVFDNLILDFGCHLYLEEEVQSRPFCKISIANAKTE